MTHFARRATPFALALMLAACTAPSAEAPTTASATPAAPSTATAPAASEDARLLAFLDAAFDEAVAMSPETLTSLGIKQKYGQLDDYTDAQAAREQAFAEAKLAEMKRDFAFDRLSPASQLSYRLFENQVAQGRLQMKWRSHRFPVTNSSTPTSNIPTFLINEHRVDTVADAEAYVARLREVERVMGEVAARVRAQGAAGIVPQTFVFAPVEADARKVLVGTPFAAGADSTLLADFKAKVGKLDAPADVKAKLIADASAALSGPFRRGYETLLAALDAVEVKAKGNDGAWSLPDGDAYYADMLRLQTTTGLTAEQIHATGLSEVARIHGEMRAIMKTVGFTGTLQQFFAELKTGAKFHYPNTAAGRQAYLADSRALIAELMLVAPKYFRRLPKAPLEVRAVEEWRQETASVAFYNSPAPDGSRPGIYYVNLADMGQVLKPQVDAISYHEGAPGHHFQIALAQELDGVPKFRRFGGYGAYSEGWGLYAEKLGKEFGFYKDPYADFGRLSLELWRATRLVTDSGMHSKRWSRERAIDYFKANTLLSDRDIVKEVERYLVWPGQATSYKVGQLRILELRAKAEAALGPKFDVRDFHATVLENGALPLDVLEEQVDGYIARAR